MLLNEEFITIYEELSELNEAKADTQKLIDFAGPELANRFLAIRNRLKAPENDLYYWIKKKTPADLEQAILNIENTKSNTKVKKELADQGAALVCETKHWLVYHITSFEAAQVYGRDTKWCITGIDGTGDHYWNGYKKEGAAFYFFISKVNYDPRGRDSKFSLAIYPHEVNWFDDGVDFEYEVYNQVDWQLSDLSAIPYIEEVKIPGIDFNRIAVKEDSSEGLCDECQSEVDEDTLLGTAYGNFICERCWDRYINSEDGLVEYFINIANKDASPRDFNNDILNRIISVWVAAKKSQQLMGLSDSAIEEYETDFIKELFAANIEVDKNIFN